MIFGDPSSASREVERGRLARLEWREDNVSSSSERCAFCREQVTTFTHVRAKTREIAHHDCLFAARDTLRRCGVKLPQLPGCLDIHGDLERAEREWREKEAAR